MNNRPKYSDTQDLRRKIFKYCSYQERCHQEVRSRLYDYGADHELVETLIVELIEQNYLNEQRFAEAVCRGKFLHNKWGRNKIRQWLVQKKISAYCIKQGMKEIDDEAYDKQLNQLAMTYMDKYRKLKLFERKQKTARYLMSKGYEHELIWDLLRPLQ